MRTEGYRTKISPFPIGLMSRILFQAHQPLLNDHWIFNAGNDLGAVFTDSASLNINAEYSLEPLGPGHRRMTLNRELLALDIRCFKLSPLLRFARVSSARSLLFGEIHRETMSD